MNKELTFLIVDDDGQVRDILDGYLRSFGFTKILQAKDGKAGLKILQDHHQVLDFVISDWEMPHIDGLTLLRALRKDPVRSDVKFIMVTSQGSRERMKITKAAKSHVDAYVVKPFRAHILQEKINNLLNGIIDESVREFEGELLPEVPSNEMSKKRDAARKAKEKAKNGSVFLDKEQRGAGILVGLNKKKGPGQFGSVTVPKPKIELQPIPEEAKNEHLDLVLKLSGSYVKVRWFDKAINLCLEAAQIFPESADVFTHLARAYFMKEDYESASQALARAVKLRPYDVEALTLLDEINMKTGA